jgi:hypothetical protein
VSQHVGVGPRAIGELDLRPHEHLRVLLESVERADHFVADIIDLADHLSRAPWDEAWPLSEIPKLERGPRLLRSNESRGPKLSMIGLAREKAPVNE